MLAELSIRNFAIIDDLGLTLEPGMTVLSGETGAGKSILIDALGLLLGDRADADAVRDGAERAEIDARFRLDDAPAARAWLNERELDDGDECVLRRVILREGRSRNWINGSPAAARDLKALGECLVDIHGQHEHQSLLRTAVQREIVDGYGGHEDSCVAVAESHARLRDLERRIAEIEQVGDDGESRLDLLRYQVRELDALDLKPGELDELESEHKRLANAERLIGDGRRALALLYESEDNSAMDVLGAAERLLGELVEMDAGFGEPRELAGNARIQVQEAADGLRRAVDGLELDPERLVEVESRLAGIQDLARKHRCKPETLPERLQRLREELEDLEGAGERLAALRTERDAAHAEYRQRAEALHAARGKAAVALAEAVTAGMRELGMPQGMFEVGVDYDADATPAAHGNDHIGFRVSANPGHAPRALERVASGGELSRISLAIQVVAAAGTRVPSLIFDEVDAGIGGGVAEIVGRQLRRLGGDHQTLCVTHLPQVAAQAQQHLYVSKEIADGVTRTRIRELAADHRVEELARMLGGVEITDRSRAHAREMIERAAS
jgi:DNA repair protein RecN (Recombination protein N)